MKKLLALFVALALSFAGGLARAQMPSPPEVAARSYILIDVTTGQTLAEREADTAYDPASLTKLMTAYLVFTALREHKLTLEQVLPVSVRAWEERKGGGSLMFIEPRSKPKVSDLLRGLIVNSGNDAAVVLAEGVGGSLDNFVAMMNRQAQAWGLKNTAFKNVAGLTEAGHKSTARDVAVIASHIINDFPEHYALYSIKRYRFEGSPATNENNRNVLLLRDPSVDGMKTGYTEAAGYCMVISAQRDFPNLAPSGTGGGKRRLLSVVMGTASMEARANESQKLLNWGFQAFDTVRLFAADKALATVPVWKGKQNEVHLGSSGGVFVSVPKGEGAKLQTRIERTDPLVAPLPQGQRVGTVKVSTPGGAVVAERPLVVMSAVEQAGILGRAWDAVRLWIK